MTTEFARLLTNSIANTVKENKLSGTGYGLLPERGYVQYHSKNVLLTW